MGVKPHLTQMGDGVKWPYAMGLASGRMPIPGDTKHAPHGHCVASHGTLGTMAAPDIRPGDAGIACCDGRYGESALKWVDPHRGEAYGTHMPGGLMPMGFAH